jgi:hypothetical protein
MVEQLVERSVIDPKFKGSNPGENYKVEIQRPV